MRMTAEQEMKLLCRVQALELFIIGLARRVPELRKELERSQTLVRDLPNLGVAIPGQPLEADMLTDELQEAYTRLLRQALQPED